MYFAQIPTFSTVPRLKTILPKWTNNWSTDPIVTRRTDGAQKTKCSIFEFVFEL